MSRPIMSPDEYFAGCSPRAREIGHALRALVMRYVPEAIEKVYGGWGVIGYRAREQGGRRAAYFGYINRHPDHATVGFKYGAALSDPDGLLENENLLQVRFVSVRDANDPRLPAIGAMIRQAADVALMPNELRRMLMFSRATDAPPQP